MCIVEALTIRPSILPRNCTHLSGNIAHSINLPNCSHQTGNIDDIPLALSQVWQSILKNTQDLCLNQISPKFSEHICTVEADHGYNVLNIHKGLDHYIALHFYAYNLQKYITLEAKK